MLLNLLDLLHEFVSPNVSHDSDLLVMVVDNNLIDSSYVIEAVLYFLLAFCCAALPYAELLDRDHVRAVMVVAVH